MATITLFAISVANAKPNKAKEVREYKEIEAVCISDVMMATDSHGDWILMSMTKKPTPATCTDLIVLSNIDKIYQISGEKYRTYAGILVWVLVKPAAPNTSKK